MRVHLIGPQQRAVAATGLKRVGGVEELEEGGRKAAATKMRWEAQRKYPSQLKDYGKQNVPRHPITNSKLPSCSSPKSAFLASLMVGIPIRIEKISPENFCHVRSPAYQQARQRQFQDALTFKFWSRVHYTRQRVAVVEFERMRGKEDIKNNRTSTLGS